VSLLRVVKPGMLTTVQDLGRWGRQGLGVPVAGPMDSYSHRLANWLVGNDPTAAALEITLIGPELEAGDDVTCAVSGAAFAIRCGDAVAPMNERFVLPAGRRLRFGERGAGARATLAVGGGLLVPPLFGSRATSVVAQLGGLEGRPLKAGDELRVGGSADIPSSDYAPVLPVANTNSRATHVPALPMPAGGARPRVIRGPQAKMFTAAAYDALFASRYTITANSNRMGYRLEGAPLSHAGAADILSDATPIGSIQVPAAGQPILLMADRQTTGGYPKIGTVISADLPLAGQLAPGDWIEFHECTRAQAVDALRQRMKPFLR
jgi:antagonist of KipI